MKLVHPLLETPIVFSENIVNILTVENQKVFSGLICELLAQIDGKEGEFILSEGLQQLSLENNVECVLEPFSIDFNQRKVITKLYAQLKEKAVGSDLYMSSAGLSCRIFEYIEKITQTVEYPLVYSSEIDMTSVFKLVDLKLEENHENMVEKILDYMTIVQEFLCVSFFVFVNLKNFLSDDDLKALYKSAMYKKMSILLFENTVREKCFEQEKIYIIDSDLCSIY